MLRVKRICGFTLVELLVVISLVAVLAAALATQFTKARAMGQAIRCKANLHNLAKAALGHGVDCGHLPFAGSYEGRWATAESSQYVLYYHENKGWVNWTGPGKWPNKDMQSEKMKKACYYGDAAYQSITNGTLWSYVGKDLGAYTCDVHKKVARRAGLEKVMRSYVMNGYFAFDHKPNPTPENFPDWRWIPLDALAARGSAANLLLFAEMPAFKGKLHAEEVSKDQNGTGADSVLETDLRGYVCKEQEVLGFNHQVAKRYVAHVVFADGHVEALVEPQGAKDSDLVELAKQLCNGDELSQDIRATMR